MLRHFFVLLFVLLGTGMAAASEPWTGQWQLTWRNGGAVVTIQQDGESLRGSYGNGRGHLEGRLRNGQFEGQNIYDGLAEDFSAILAGDGQSFAGRTEAGDWLNGLRITGGKLPGAASPTDMDGPRAAMRRFLAAGNLGQIDQSRALAWVIDVIEFGDDPGWAARETRFDGAEQLFDLVDLATFSIAAIPEQAPGPRLALSLPRLDSKPPVEIEMVLGSDGAWRILMPSPDALRAALATAEPRPADAFRQMQNPRDTLRTFLSGIARWDSGGEAEAVSALDLTQVPEVLRFHEGILISQYLVRLIDRVGSDVLQSIPNSGASREPFVYFENPAGRVVIEPVGAGADTRWKFSAATVGDIRKLYRAVELLPDGHALDGLPIPASTMFAIRDTVKAHAPALLNSVGGRGRIEYWQLMGALLLFSGIIAATLVLRRLVLWLLMRPWVKHHVRNPRRLAGALALGAAFAIGAPLVLQLGLPAAARQYSLPVVGTTLLVIMSYAGWQVIAALSSIMEKLAERTVTPIDNILLTFFTGLARLALIVAAALGLSQLWSVPTTGLLAGLGISGLAVAFASKETIANLFGAGILLSDRPFRKGDRIIAGDVNGWVESVGLRSTRIRTIQDSMLIVPNGRLADMTVNNLGLRRRSTLSSSVIVTSGGTPERLQALTDAISARIAADPLFEPDATEVNISGINASGVTIDISASLATRDGRTSRAAAHRLYLDIMRTAEELGLALGNGTQKQPLWRLGT